MNWVFEQQGIDWTELCDLYRVAPLGDKPPEHLQLVFSNSLFKCFVYDEGKLVGAGRALADGADCAYVCDVAVHPDAQGCGLGSAIIDQLKELAAGHAKIILYAKPGTERFYQKLGFRRMRTALAIFRDEQRALRTGLIDEQ